MIECLHPKIFVNPALPQLLCTYKHYFLNGKWHTFIYDSKVLFQRSWLRTFYKLKHSVTFSNIDNYFVCDDNGYKYPIFLQTRCGHCILCTNSAHNIYASRLLAESQLYKVRPCFCTLTYNDCHLPSDGASVRDCQTFLKRFRINLQRKFNYHEKVRYFLCAEYGSDIRFSHRPHYHVIFFNLPIHTPSETWKVRELMRLSWSNGFVHFRPINMSKPYEFYYTSKYVNKDVVIPDGKNKTFFLSSRRNGGIGANFYKRFRDFFFRESPIELTFVNRFSGQLCRIPYSHYMMKYIAPTFNESVPLAFRKAVHSFNTFYDAYSYIPEVRFFFGNYHQKLLDLVTPYFTPEPSLCKTKHPCLDYLHFVLDGLREYIDKFNFTPSLFNHFKLTEYVRKDVYQKIFSTLTPLTDAELRHKADLILIKQQTKQLKKQLHYVN